MRDEVASFFFFAAAAWLVALEASAAVIALFEIAVHCTVYVYMYIVYTYVASRVCSLRVQLRDLFKCAGVHMGSRLMNKRATSANKSL